MATKDVVKKIDLGGKGIPKTLSGKITPPKKEIMKDTVTKLGSLSRFRKAIEGGDNDDAAKKAARIAAIKKAALNNKKYNVGTSTAADATATPALSSLLGGGGYGGGYYTEGGESGGFSLSDIPSIVWIILAVGAGYWLIKSGGKGKKLF